VADSWKEQREQDRVLTLSTGTTPPIALKGRNANVFIITPLQGYEGEGGRRQIGLKPYPKFFIPCGNEPLRGYFMLLMNSFIIC
jgi:hypothetical protein